MKKIKIITDSACDLDIEYLESINVHMIPMTVHFENETFYDRTTIKPGDFYDKLKKCDELPKTSQINPAAFVDEFTKFLNQGYHIISICFSSGLSGTYQSACIAKDMLGNGDIDVIDSKAASVGFGLIVREAALMANEGKSIEDIIERIEYMRDRMEHIFAVGSLEMLKRGGRISTAQAVVGKLLNVKPILQIENGFIIPYDKVRGEKGIIKKMIETMKDRGHKLENQVIGLNFAGNTELCMQLKDEIAKEFGVKDFVISEIGAAIGTHAGPGTVSIFFLRK